MTHFRVPPEPRLRWTMLFPRSEEREFPSSVNGRPTYNVFWARNGIYHGLRALGVSPGDNILVPSFHCATLVEPILQYGATVTFYNIHRDCSPDFGDIRAKIGGTTRAVLALHYFGFPQPIRKFQELCKDNGLYLIEDCAHVLAGEVDGAALGSFGDISVFSWRKFLPVYDGGHLVINNPTLHIDIPWERQTPLFVLKVAKNILEKIIDDSGGRASTLVSQLSRFPSAIVRGLLSPRKRHPRAFAINNYGDFDLSLVNVGMSGLSRYIMRNSDIPEILEKRRVNYTSLLKAMESFTGLTPIFPHLPEGVSPWVFPALVHGRDNFHLALRSRGIPAVTWGGVIHRDLPLEEFPEATFLYHNLVFLPLHQSIGDSEMRTMIHVLKELLRQGQ